MRFIDRIQPRDIIALVVLIACFILKAIGINTYLDLVIAVIIGYYFSKRVYEERNGYVNPEGFIVRPKSNRSEVPERILKSGERKQDFRSR